MHTEIGVGPGARLHWLPQETILFDRASLSRRLEVSLAADAEMLLCETLVFGRAAMGERIGRLALVDRISVDRAGVPLYRDGIRLTEDAHRTLGRAATGGGAGAVTSLVYAAPDAAAQLAAVRAMLPETAGASLRDGSLLIVRLLAPDSLNLRRHLIPVLERLSGMPLPSVWRL